jgi:hypothetical protein
MAQRKYFTEFAVNMFGTWRILLQQDNLEDPNLRQILPPNVPFHIYMITRRPRIAWDPDTLQFDEEHFSGTFTIQRGSAYERHGFQVRNLLGTDQVQISCPFPHTEYELLDPAGQRLAYGKVPLAMSTFGSEFWNFMDLEVLYIGQAYGDEGSRVAPDRLKSHSTLQGIYAEAIRRSPDKDIWIVLWSFEPLLITSMDGRLKAFGTTDAQDEEHRDQVLRFELTEQQQINFTEAALIRYFKPEYNFMFKDSFPSPAHTTYSQCYDLDLNAVNVELQTEEIMCRLWSPSVQPMWTHFARFDLHSPEERKSMFDYGV